MNKLEYKATIRTSEEVIIAKSVKDFTEQLSELTGKSKEVLCIGAKVYLCETIVENP